MMRIWLILTCVSGDRPHTPQFSYPTLVGVIGIGLHGKRADESIEIIAKWQMQGHRRNKSRNVEM